jgi:hypothetical protein
MPRHERILEQLKRNAVALISLVVAITGLSYNTWRNEQTEFNRNQRGAAFEILLKLAELDEIVNLAHYEASRAGTDDLKRGWALVNTIDVLTSILAEPMPASGDRLVATWSTYSPRLGRADEGSVGAIRRDIDHLQDEIVTRIKSLE